MYGWPFLDVVTYGAMIGLIAEVSQRTIKLPKTPALMLAAGLWVGSVMSHVAHGYFKGMMDTIPETFKLCLFVMLLVVVINSIARVRWVIIILLIGAVLMAIHSVLQVYTGAGFGGQTPIIYYYSYKEKWIQQSQFYGIFSDPNDLGQFLATCVPLVFAVPKRLGFMTVIIALALVYLLGEGLLGTESRGTLIGVVAAVACTLFLWLPPKWMPYFGVLILIGGLVACAFGGAGMLDQSARDRLEFWGNANRYFKSHLLFGGGYGMFSEVSGTNRPAHNAFVCCYTELGLFGYWFWFNMMTLGIIGCWRTRVAFERPRNYQQKYLKRVAGLCIASIVGFAASSFFLTRAYVFPLFFLFGLLAAVPMVAERYLPENHPPLVNFRKDVLFTGTLTALFSVAYTYSVIVLLNRGNGG
ncbi:MAG: O-antigen ligase family protein [bacterium]